MKRFPIVSSVMTQVKFSESRLENYFNSLSRNDKESDNKFSEDFENICSRSTHTLARGSVQIVFGSKESNVVICVDIPTTTYFLVTGVKTESESYKLKFALSMS